MRLAPRVLSEGMPLFRQRAWWVTALMIIFAGGGLLFAAAVIPCMMPAKGTARRNACINNLRQIDGAKEQWAYENKKSPDAKVKEEQLVRYIKGAEQGFPKCPTGGRYAIGQVAEAPICTIAGHSLK